MIQIGTSGWSYDHWQGNFYPQNVRADQRLEYYCKTFSSAEINNSFYNLPAENTLRQWYETTPKDFLFAVKASRYITHMKKLKDPAESLDRFLDRIAVLDDKLGPILFQLPPKWSCNVARLRSFLATLPGHLRYAFEFRDHSWHSQAVYDLLREHNSAFCIYDLAGFISPKEVTADFIYLRLHGPKGSYEGQYSKRDLGAWAGAFNSWKQAGHDIFCYFDNDQNGYAAKNARQLNEMITC